VICLAEGFATAATVHEFTGHAAVAAINRTSLLAVAQSFRKRFQEARILCADDDWMREREGKGNPGLTDARAAAATVGGVVVVPEFSDGRGEKDTDFNDMARVAGRDAVRKCIQKALDGKMENKKEIPPEVRIELPVIKLKAGQLERIVDETERAAIAADRGLYQRGGVRIGEIELLGAAETKTTALAIIEQNEHTLLEDAAASASYLRFDKRASEWVPAGRHLGAVDLANRPRDRAPRI
jgi:hypothetical protein